MARPRRERSLGEMISSVCFYFVGAYFVLEGLRFMPRVARRLDISVCGWLVWPACLVEHASNR